MFHVDVVGVVGVDFVAVVRMWIIKVNENGS